MASRLLPCSGVVDGVNRDFAVPSVYRPGTLVVFLNGQQLKRTLDNGWEEVDPAAGTFRMKLPPVGPRPGSTDDPGDVLYAYFDTDASASTGGAGGGVPEVLALDVLNPRLRDGSNLRPRMAAAEGVDPDAGAPLLGEAEEVRPEMKTADALRPKMAGAEEV